MQLKLGKVGSAAIKVGEKTADADGHQLPGDLGDDGRVQGRGMRVQIVRYRGGFEAGFGAAVLRRSRRVSGLSPARNNLVPERGAETPFDQPCSRTGSGFGAWAQAVNASQVFLPPLGRASRLCQLPPLAAEKKLVLASCSHGRPCRRESCAGEEALGRAQP